MLAQLHGLRSLSLVSQKDHLMPPEQQHSDFTFKKQSFTGDVLRAMQHLATISVYGAHLSRISDHFLLYVRDAGLAATSHRPEAARDFHVPIAELGNITSLGDLSSVRRRSRPWSSTGQTWTTSSFLRTNYYLVL